MPSCRSSIAMRPAHPLIRTPLLGLILSLPTLGLGMAAGAFQKDASTTDSAAFFETKVRPVLAERCFPCHSDSAKEIKGGLKLDSRNGLIQGGQHGPAVIPGDPAASRLIRAIGYADESLKM